MTQVVFWQSMISQHQSALVRELANLPGYEVTYVAAEEMDKTRAQMGWTQPDLGKAELIIAPDSAAIKETVQSFGDEAIHLCQGFRGNGLIAEALPLLARRNARIGVMMEAIDQRGSMGFLKKPVYRQRIRKFAGAVNFCLAIGSHASNFLADCRYAPSRTYPFTYFLDPPKPDEFQIPHADFRITFIGQLIHLKRVDLLLEAWKIPQDQSVRLSIVGDGALRDHLYAQAPEAEWLGTLPAPSVAAVLQTTDCLVLPSEYDGWGAVVTEALLSGTPAICSTECGAAEAVRASGQGGVFQSGDAASLSRLLQEQVAKGSPGAHDRKKLSNWAKAGLTGAPGARYLDRIIQSVYSESARPDAPWLSPLPAEKP